MNPGKNPDKQKWIARLKREAENQLPPFSPALHDQIMRKAGERMPRTGFARRASAGWIFPQWQSWSRAAAAIMLVAGIAIWMQFQTRQLAVQKPTARPINLSYMLPDPSVLMNQAATRWQDQFSEEPYAGLPEQARQLSRYVVKKMSMF